MPHVRTWMTAIGVVAALAGCAPSPLVPASLRPQPWSRPADTKAAVTKAGLSLLQSEGTTFHIHAHLDVFVDGNAVAVPANIGIDTVNGGISALHTHDGSGVLHIESPEKRDFTLGQFFTEWDVSLTGASAWVNGTKVADPAALVLAEQQQIVISYGLPPAVIPSTYPTGVR